MSIKDYLLPYVPASERLNELGVAFSLERQRVLGIELDISPERRREEVGNAQASGLRLLFGTLADGATRTGKSFNTTPADDQSRDIMAGALFARIGILEQDRTEALPLLFDEFRRLASRQDIDLPHGARLEVTAEGVMLHPGTLQPKSDAAFRDRPWQRARVLPLAELMARKKPGATPDQT